MLRMFFSVVRMCIHIPFLRVIASLSDSVMWRQKGTTVRSALAPGPAAAQGGTLLGDGDGDVAEFQAAGVIALDVEGAGVAFIRIERAAGDALDFFAVDGGDSVVDHRHGAAH